MQHFNIVICNIMNISTFRNVIKLILFVATKFINPFSKGNKRYADACRLDPGKLLSNSAAGLRSNLFANSDFHYP